MVDVHRRAQTQRNHSATHLMHKALRQVLGGHVQQKGSLVDADKTRFDFSHHSPMTAAQIREVESLVNDEVRQVIAQPESQGLVLDMFRTFVEPLEIEFGVKSNHRVGRFSDAAKSQEYNDRIEAINFSLAHDDGQSSRNLAEADVILVGVSRCGKTPTSLYLAMQHGIKAANYPLIPEDFDRSRMPVPLAPYKAKCFGLTIDPERLAQVRHERRPGSAYASLSNCRQEVRDAEAMMRREGIGWLSSTHKSIEEIATTILRDIRPDRLVY
jgi:regulator of PEP synthase PpsR (kinase-PPPase family)